VINKSNASKLKAKESSPHRGKTRQDILLAATREFARSGFTGASTLLIAKNANSKQPLLHYHFGSKEKLWLAAVDFAFIELKVTFDTIEETAGDLEEIDILKLMLRTINRFASRHPLHIDILRQEMGSESRRSQYILKNYLSPMYLSLNAVIKSATDKGQIKKVHPQFLSSMLFGAFTHYYTSGPSTKAMFSIDINDPAKIKQHGDWLVEIIFRGLANE